jgi:ketosteroid isomerase-like protein
VTQEHLVTEKQKHLTAREVAEAIADSVATKQAPDVFAEDVVYIMPFALPGAPTRIEGRAAVEAMFEAARSSAASNALKIQEVVPTFYEGEDSDVVVFETLIRGESTATGQPFEFNSSIGVLSVRDGRLVQWRDYPNTITGALESGTLPQLITRLQQLV